MVHFNKAHDYASLFIVYSVAFFQIAKETGQDKREEEVRNAAATIKAVVSKSRCTMDRVRRRMSFMAQDVYQGRILQEVDRFVGYWRQDALDDLRQDDAAHCLDIIHTQNLGPFILPLIDRLNATAENFGKVGRIV